MADSQSVSRQNEPLGTPEVLADALVQFHVADIPEHMILAARSDVAWVAGKWAEKHYAEVVAERDRLKAAALDAVESLTRGPLKDGYAVSRLQEALGDA